MFIRKDPCCSTGFASDGLTCTKSALSLLVMMVKEVMYCNLLWTFKYFSQLKLVSPSFWEAKITGIFFLFLSDEEGRNKEEILIKSFYRPVVHYYIRETCCTLKSFKTVLAANPIMGYFFHSIGSLWFRSHLDYSFVLPLTDSYNIILFLATFTENSVVHAVWGFSLLLIYCLLWF